MANDNTWNDALYEAVTGRLRPEDVAKKVVSYFPHVPHIVQWCKRQTTRSYMPAEFAEMHPLTVTANALAFLLNKPLLTPGQTLGKEMTALLNNARATLQADGALDYRQRLNREGRQKAGVTLSKRQYNRIYRTVMFLEKERAHNQQFGIICDLLRSAKSGLARHLTKQEFSKDENTAIFVAYMCARMNLRSQFTVGPQVKAFDDLCQNMLGTLKGSLTTNWFAVAHVFPHADVIQKLTDSQKTDLLALSLAQLRQAAVVLSDLHQECGIDYRVSTTVRRGQDSSTWNAAAGAWNKTRDWWLSLLEAMNMWDSLEYVMPGKVLRLMAADVVEWHESTGDTVHPDERVARELPAPWEVFLDGVECSRASVHEACAKHGVNSEKSGWVTARPRNAVESWCPTPELVHGVTVNHPELALIMRKLKWFSGPAKFYKKARKTNTGTVSV